MNEQLENNNKQVVINRLINKKLNNLLMLPIHYKKRWRTACDEWQQRAIRISKMRTLSRVWRQKYF